MTWRGQRFALRFGLVELELADDAGQVLRWQATVAFTAANIRYPLLGNAGCLQFMNTKFLGLDHAVELEPNPSFPAIGPP
jgi:hypothetical protein